MKSWKTPTPEQVNRAVALLGHVEQIRYFFDKLENPEWIKPLKAKRFFSTPPEPQHDEERGTVGFPPWPELRYLVRMASIKPDTVLEVILEIPDDHGNVRIYEDLVDIALNLPPNLAVSLTEKAKSWIRSPYHFLLPEKIGALVGNLAEGGQFDAALDLARVLLEVLPDQRYQAKSSEDDIYRLPPEPGSHFDKWHYEKILKSEIPKLLEVDGTRTLQLLCDLLDETIRLSEREREEIQDYEDYSCIWRPAIENHSQNRSYGLKDPLVESVRDVAESMAKKDPSSVPQIVQILEGRSWKVFHRIGLYLLMKFGKDCHELVAERLTNHELFNDSGVQHEYALLLGEHFGELNQENQDIIIEWIQKGPDVDRFVEREKEWTGNQPTDEEIDQYRRLWQRDRLSWFKSHLPDDWKDTYKDLVDEFGEPKQPEFPSYGATWVGPTSPKDANELKTMTVLEIVEFLTNWVPPDDLFASSLDRLGRVFSSVVSQDPERFVNETNRFKGLDPTYVRALLGGLREALKQNRTFPWEPILDLCHWVVQQPREITSTQNRNNADADWGYTRKSIADLLSTGFDETSGNIPIELRETVWDILRQLAEDPDPTPEDEARHLDSNGDPANFSINTVRGEALHAIVRHALWIRRHLIRLPDSRERIEAGFNEMPEVRGVLESHLDTSQDPSLAIRAVYGQRFPWLMLLDSNWAEDKVSEIFPADESLRSFFIAAWETYMLYCSPYDNVYDVLIEQYEFAVSETSPTTENDRDDDYYNRLAEHLMAFYWRGKLELGEAKGLLSKFWANGSPNLRGYALDFIGRSLDRTEGPVPDDVLNRLRILWEKRLEVAKQAESPDSHRAEISAFGLWFVSGKFNTVWAMSQLREALSIAGKVEQDHKVVKKLVDFVEVMPKETVECLQFIVKGDREGWRTHGFRDEAKLILAKALKTEASIAAESVIHYLGSRGYMDFRGLLNRTSVS